MWRIRERGMGMKIVGLQKLTLLDYPGRVACTVFLNGCNFSCPFCHNSQLLQDAPEIMSVEELLAFLEKRKGVLDGVCITGGEPTLHEELIPLLRRIKALNYPVKLDTNGYRPAVLVQAVREGLVDRVAMDIKNGPEEYGITAGLKKPQLELIEQSIRFLAGGFVDHEFRTTMVQSLHSVQSVESMAQWVLSVNGGHKISCLYLQPFVDRDTVPMEGLSAPNDEMLAKYAEILGRCAEKVELRGK